MGYDPQKHHRRSIRLKGYDYTAPGAYFVTICTQDHVQMFGEVVGGDMRLNPHGRVVDTYWSRIPRHFLHVTLDAWVVMPNHVHGIIVITDPPAVGDDASSPVDERGRCRGEAIPVWPAEMEGGAGSKSRTVTDGDSGRGEAIPVWPAEMEGGAGSKSRTVTDGDSGIASPLQRRRRQQQRPPRPHGAPSGSLGAIVGNFKSITTRRINRMRHTPGGQVWQRNYWEHIIRDQVAYERLWQYIENDPALWEEGQTTGSRTGTTSSS